MDDFRPEPSLDDLLEDPVARLVMARDGLTPGDVRRVIDAARERTAAYQMAGATVPVPRR